MAKTEAWRRGCWIRRQNVEAFSQAWVSAAGTLVTLQRSPSVCPCCWGQNTEGQYREEGRAWHPPGALGSVGPPVGEDFKLDKVPSFSNSEKDTFNCAYESAVCFELL